MAARLPWLTGSYDPDLDTLYWAIGNPGPDINGDVRKGDNLFSCSVVALDPNTGKRKWHYQFTPNDTHDWDSTEDMVLVDRMWHGQQRKLLLHADRNGVFYVIDRATGKFLAASPFVRATWVKGWDAEGRPITTENWRASPEGATVYPSLGGGSNFQAPSYSPQTGWMYFNYFDGPGRYSIGPAPCLKSRQTVPRWTRNRRRATGERRRGSSGSAIARHNGLRSLKAMKVQWKFELNRRTASRPELSPRQVASWGPLRRKGTSRRSTPKQANRCGVSRRAASIPSSAMSYSVDGKQYVAISSANVLYSFALP